MKHLQQEVLEVGGHAVPIDDLVGGAHGQHRQAGVGAQPVLAGFLKVRAGAPIELVDDKTRRLC